jgi:hypothetical protein
MSEYGIAPPEAGRPAGSRTIGRADIDPRLVSRLLFGMVNSVPEWFRPGRTNSRSAIVDARVGLALDGLGAADVREDRRPDRRRGRDA